MISQVKTYKEEINANKLKDFVLKFTGEFSGHFWCLRKIGSIEGVEIRWRGIRRSKGDVWLR